MALPMTAANSHTAQSQTEKELFFANLASKREQGLMDVKFFPAAVFGASEDEIYGELNRMESGGELPDPELFPSGKLIFD